MPATFKLTANSVRSLQRLGNAPTEIAAGTKQGLADHAWALKKSFRASRGKGARGLRYESPQWVGQKWVVVFKLRYIAAWLEKGTRAHVILPTGLGRARLHRQTGGQRLLRASKAGRQFGARALMTPQGPRGRANVKGIPARWLFEQHLAKNLRAGNDRIADAVSRRMREG